MRLPSALASTKPWNVAAVSCRTPPPCLAPGTDTSAVAVAAAAGGAGLCACSARDGTAPAGVEPRKPLRPLGCASARMVRPASVGTWSGRVWACGGGQCGRVESGWARG
eukprot:364953-Chlamydomonas_euryale.AAC.6